MSRAVSILIVDSDGRLLERLSKAIGSAGYNVRLATNGLEAYSICLETPPDMIVTADEMPIVDGWTMMRLLGVRPSLSTLPVVMLSRSTDDITRLRGYREGIADFVQKPFTDEEVLIRIRRITRAIVPEQDRVVLQGKLYEIGPTTILSLFEFEQRSGILMLRTDLGAAKIYVCSGRVVMIEATGTRSADPREQLMELLDWRNGIFEFTACEVVERDELGATTSSLILEHARLDDERRRAMV